MKSKKDMDDDIDDVDEIDITDVTLKSDFYIHRAMLRAQKALTNDNFEEGMQQYRHLVEYMERVAKADKRLSDNYDRQVKEFEGTNEYKAEAKFIVRSTLLAHKKLELIMTELFSYSTSNAPLKT